MNNYDPGNYKNILENVNVSEQNDFSAFFKAIGMFLLIVVLLYLLLCSATNIAISNLSIKNQNRLEEFLSGAVKSQFKDINTDDSNEKLYKLKKIEPSLVNQDSRLQAKKNFEYHIIKSKEANAFVTADGTIYFTDKLFDYITTDEQLAFVLAHEMGHYVHKDHLKTFSRQIAGLTIGILVAAVSGKDNIVDFVMKSINFTEISYSQQDEILADKFANKLILNIYHSNDSVVEFFKSLDKEHENLTWLYYFSTHPSPEKRIKLLKSKHS